MISVFAKLNCLKCKLSEIKVQYRSPTDHFPVVSDENICCFFDRNYHPSGARCTLLLPASPHRLQIPTRLISIVSKPISIVVVVVVIVVVVYVKKS